MRSKRRGSRCCGPLHTKVRVVYHCDRSLSYRRRRISTRIDDAKRFQRIIASVGIPRKLIVVYLTWAVNASRTTNICFRSSKRFWNGVSPLIVKPSHALAWLALRPAFAVALPCGNGYHRRLGIILGQPNVGAVSSAESPSELIDDAWLPSKSLFHRGGPLAE